MKIPSCIEVAGPPGSGKSTLVRELLAGSPRLRLANPPQWRAVRDLPFFLKSAISAAPVFASFLFRKDGRKPGRKDLIWLMVLSGGPRRLARFADDGIVPVLDQGPLYMLSGLVVYRGPGMDRPFFRTWLGKALDGWGSRPDGVVWLDADDEVLSQRINSRPQDHLIKRAPAVRTREFIAESRAALERAAAIKGGAPAVLRFDTGRLGAGEIAAQVLAEWGLDRR